jgi:putative flippase GtrA
MLMVFELGRMGDELYLTIPALIISAVSIFLLNYFITFRNAEKKTRLQLSIIFAVVTAPYTFLVPSEWLY